jgi:hypothetical protein
MHRIAVLVREDPLAGRLSTRMPLCAADAIWAKYVGCKSKPSRESAIGLAGRHERLTNEATTMPEADQALFRAL